MSRKNTIIPISTRRLFLLPSLFDKVITAALMAPVLLSRPIAEPIVRIIVIKAMPPYSPAGMSQVQIAANTRIPNSIVLLSIKYLIAVSIITHYTI